MSAVPGSSPTVLFGRPALLHRSRVVLLVAVLALVRVLRWLDPAKQPRITIAPASVVQRY